MGFDKVKMKQIRNLIFLISIIILALIYSHEVFAAIAICIGILKPFLYGGAIAFALNIPMSAIEKKLLSKWTGKSAAKMKRMVSILLSLILIFLIVTVGFWAIMPQITKTMVDLGNKIPVFVQDIWSQLENLSVNYPQMDTFLAQFEDMKIDWQSLVNSVVSFLRTGMTNVLSSTVSVASSIADGVMNAVIGIIFAFYILGQKETLANQGKRILTAYLAPRFNKKVIKVLELLYQNFSNFITGQCVEAVILGCMFTIAMTIFRMPYALLVGVLISFSALIPIVGAFIGCFVGAFLIMVDNPMKAIAFVILFLVLQQIEGNLIYPRVVGNKVGLPAIWVLFAVSIGGSLMGVVGMLVFIPLVSTGYCLLRDSVNERNSRKNHNYNYNQRKNKSNHQQSGKEGGKVKQ